LYFWASLKTFFSMALLRLQTIINPQTATSVVGGSAAYVYNTDQINFLTLASRSGDANQSVFDYQLNAGGVGKAIVKGTVASIITATGAATVVA
jgi:hypothetical protein